MNIYCFDFDGVICDSAGETGATGWRAAGRLWPAQFAGDAPAAYLEQYRIVRPVLETGYESILLARLLAEGVGTDAILADAPSLVAGLIAREGLDKEKLIRCFSEVRDEWMATDLPGWLGLNGFYEGVAETVAAMAARDRVFVITTKQHRYAMALLERAGIALPPEQVFGLEAGKKGDVLRRLAAEPAHAGAAFHFFEDRLPTLEQIAATPGLEAVQLYLASWGYTTPAELARAAAQPRITLLTRTDFLARYRLGELLELTISDVAYGGDGVGRTPAGKAIFVPFTAIGDRVRVRVTEDRKRFARATVVELLEAGPHRAQPACRHFGRCGGCQYQHLEYAEQLRLKARQLAESLRRVGHVSELPPVDPIVSDRPYGYRNKLELHPVQGAQPAVCGFVGTDQATVIPITHCPVADPRLEQDLQSLKPEDIRHASLTLRIAENGRVYRYYGRSPRRDLWLRETWRGLKLNQPLGSFAQVNTAIARKLVDWIEEAADAAKPNLLLDLYCGAGLFALNLGHLPKRIIGIEQDSESIRAARFTARKWGLATAEFIAGDVEARLPKLLRSLKAPSESLVIVDPPRAGAASRVIDSLAAWRPATIVYVSCEVTSQARDLQRLLAKAPYRIDRLALFDMFPQTGHFESVVCLKLSGQPTQTRGKAVAPTDPGR